MNYFEKAVLEKHALSLKGIKGFGENIFLKGLGAASKAETRTHSLIKDNNLSNWYRNTKNSPSFKIKKGLGLGMLGLAGTGYVAKKVTEGPELMKNTIPGIPPRMQ